MESQACRGRASSGSTSSPGAKIEAAVAQLDVHLAVRPARPAARHVRRRSSSATAPPACPSCSSRVVERDPDRAGSSTTRRTSSAPSSPPCRARRSACPTGARRGRSWSTSIPRRSRPQGLSPSDVVNAISAQNLILPAGTAKIGAREYSVASTAARTRSRAFNDLPIKQVNGADRLHPRRGPRARRLRGADQHRAPRRPPRPPASRSSRAAAPPRSTWCERIKDMLPAVQVHPAAGARPQAPVRPVGLRARRHRRGAAGGGHRGRASPR